MRLAADRRLCAVWMLAVLLAGCATRHAAGPPLDRDAQLRLLAGVEDFSLSGRAAVRAGEEGFNASLSWTQRGVEARIRISGPVAGSLTLTHGPDTLELRSSRGENLEGDEARAAVANELGFMPPFDALRYWVLGLPAPGEAPATRSEDAEGRLTELAQDQWLIRFERWTTVDTADGAVELPKRITATRDQLRLRLGVDRWSLD